MSRECQLRQAVYWVQGLAVLGARGLSHRADLHVREATIK